MKRLVAAAIAFTVLAAPAAIAQHGPHGHHNSRHAVKKHGPHHVQSHRWSKGQRFDRNRAHHRIDARDYRRYRLSTPPRGHQWVRSGNDFILIAATTGIISSIIGATR